MLKRLVRYSAAFVLLIYGFAKINGSQFTILDSELDKPMGQVSGFWLTWYYFGFSPFYGTFLALVQICGAVLLTFPRTTLLGACILAPVLFNIVLIDICYGIDPGATLVAAILLAAMMWLVGPRWKEMKELFWPTGNGSQNGLARSLVAWSTRVTMLVVACGFTYWVANFNNRLPTPIDGAWDIVQVQPEAAAHDVPVAIFFEFNRASMTVFKASDGTYQTHHFDIEENSNRIQISEKWLSKGAEVFSGSYALASPTLTLRGDWQKLGEVTLLLRRRRER